MPGTGEASVEAHGTVGELEDDAPEELSDELRARFARHEELRNIQPREDE